MIGHSTIETDDLTDLFSRRRAYLSEIRGSSTLARKKAVISRQALGSIYPAARSPLGRGSANNDLATRVPKKNNGSLHSVV
jgi:hypothetical protein